MHLPSSRLSRRYRSEAAYTLFEIMLVLGIISVLVGSAIFMLGDLLTDSKKQRVDSDAITVTTALKAYEMMAYSMPTTEQGLEALVVQPTSQPVPKRWTQKMIEVPKDPWGTPYLYSNPGKKNPSGFDFYSAGPDRQRDTADDVWPAR